MRAALLIFLAALLSGCPAPPISPSIVVIPFDTVVDPPPVDATVSDVDLIQDVAQPDVMTAIDLPATSAEMKVDYEPIAESCNLIDDDFDGRIDEGFISYRCRTDDPYPCDFGWSQCNFGKVECVTRFPGREVCDYLDNDCDGLIDEGRLDGPCNNDRDCVGGLICLDDVCGADCPDECDTCEVCVDDWIIEDGQPQILPGDCEAACSTCLMGCADVGGLCIDRVCRRDFKAVKCAPDARPVAAEAPSFNDDMLEFEGVEICERP